jgi:hypothetical protein
VLAEWYPRVLVAEILRTPTVKVSLGESDRFDQAFIRWLGFL